ncbi:MAG: error-prone DNA polymerase [Anaerolineae bacterium]|nr:error-prone DNA polymerase [Anaerolineae bacterium]
MDYIELHCHSNFSLLDGASPPEDLMSRAAELGMPALALTDHDNVYGAVRFAQAAQAVGIKPILGAEPTLAGGHHLTVLVENEAGWRNLCWLISQAQHNAPKGQAALPPTALPNHTEGLIALSGCRQGEIAVALLRRDREAALNAARRYRDLFSPARFWIELQHHLRPEDGNLIRASVELARHLGIGYVATNNVHYATRPGCRLQDVLVCIRHQLSLDEAGPILRPNSEFYLKSAQQLAPLFTAYPEALTNTGRIAERCDFTLQYGLQDLPRFPTPPNLTAEAYLHHLCEAALPQRYPDSAVRAAEQLAHELAIIEGAGLANYFLIVWDIVRFAREQGIRCQGRGSAANSIAAYLLNLSPIDPLEHHLVFERFLSAERAIAPDIDLDFEALDPREAVIQYVYERYGLDHAAMACTFVTFQKRSAMRDIAKVLGLAEAAVKQAADQLADSEMTSLPAENGPLGLLLDLSRQIHNYPRHLGIHNGGMILTGPPLTTRLPTEPATMANRFVVQWDKESLEAAGLIKIDLLGLRMLSAISETVQLVERTRGIAPDLEERSFKDPAVYELIAAADTLGVFQVESRAQSQMLPCLQPRCFNDLIVAISLIRPGPIQGNMVHPYLRRRTGLEPVTYLHPRLESALAETLGVILFQEQVLKVARDLAGFTAGQGEQLRRALGARQGGIKIQRFREAFLSGAQANGVSLAVAEAVFEQLRAFGGYAFAKSHAAAFAVLVYQSAWLKRYYPAEFLAAIMNNQPMGFWNPAVLVGDAQRRGIPVLPVDIQRSRNRCTVEQEGIRLGFNYIAGLGEGGITRLEEARRVRSFTNLADFCRRTQLPRRMVQNLILVGAMDGWGIPRRKLLWELGQLRYAEAELDWVFPDEGVTLPPFSAIEEMLAEQEVLGLSTGDHVMSHFGAWITKHGILSSRELAGCSSEQQVQVAGLLVVHQSPPTAKGFYFLTLEDSEGLVDVIVRPQVYARYRGLIRTTSLLIVEGQVQHQGGVTNLLAERMTPLPTNPMLQGA